MPPDRIRIDHPLTPLLVPRSIAVVGASPRAHGTALSVINKLDELAFDGAIHPVNPKYDEVAGRVCFDAVADLPEPPDLAVLAVGDGLVEEQMMAAIEAGARSVAVFGSCVVPDDGTPDLMDRLRAMAREAGIRGLGANCMGFCNYEAGVHINSYPFPARRTGRITVLAQSGSVFGAMIGSRMGLNFAGSIGNEMATTVADYMDYHLELGTSRVLALFLETIRDPEAFVAALQKAQKKGVPVVALKAGRSDMAVRMAVSHSGALAGDDRAMDALFRRHGVLRVDTLDELVATALLMEQAAEVAPGALATIHDSGGERELVADIADDLGVTFAEIGPQTVKRLSERLDYGLEPENPLDAFGTGYDHDGISHDCFAALMDDPATALGLYFLDLNQKDSYSTSLAEACAAVAATSSKPIAIATNFSGVDHRELANELTNCRGIPVLDGTTPALKAARHAFAYRDYKTNGIGTTPAIDEARQSRWCDRLREGRDWDEADGLALLADYGIPALEHRIAHSADEAVAAAEQIGFPVALKTAETGIAHKSDISGVVLGLAHAEAVRVTWEDMSTRLGPRVLISAMAQDGVEMVAGAVHDPQFGPMVLLGAGGVLVEVLDDVAAMLAPAEPWEVRKVLSGLKARKLLAGARGAPPADMDALVDAVVSLSLLAHELGDDLAELDVNPLRVFEHGVVALDALVVPASS